MLGTREDFDLIRQQISIETVANLLMQKQGKMYIYPGEKTGSIKLYPTSRSFYDFGSCTGGDAIRLWSHIKGCDSWTALNEIRKTFGLNTPDKQHSREAIKAAEQSWKRKVKVQKQKQERWVKDVDALKAEAELLSGILSSGHCEPLSWLWCVCQNRLTSVSGRLDLLCGV